MIIIHKIQVNYILICCPSLILPGSRPGFFFMMLSIVVLFLLAIPPNVSPGLTVYKFPVVLFVLDPVPFGTIPFVI